MVMENVKYLVLVAAVILTVLYFCDQGCKENTTEVPSSEVGTWTKVERGVTSRLYDIDFADEQHGWVVGDSGMVLYSGNGGESWQRQTCPIQDVLLAVDFVDNENGWICSRNSILKTIDRGRSWKVKHSEDLGEGHFYDIQFLNKNTGFVVGGRGPFGSIGVLKKTRDGGETWQKAAVNELRTLSHISVVDEQNIWICGFDGTILCTTDIGLTWTKKNLNAAPPPSLTTIQFVDEYNGWVGSRDDWLGFFRTTDGGNTWIQRSKESLSIFGISTFFFVDSLHGWLGTFPGAGPFAIAQTADGGQTWRFLPENMNVRDIAAFSFINKDLGWAVGLELSDSIVEGVILCYRSIK
ncbi:MAG: YCF48-related protein [candidate division KSB1 bacterium]|nr:YCF48-related protein [candidate division KSB1 bacterium]